MKRYFSLFISLFLVGCGGTSSSGTDSGVPLLKSNIPNDILVVEGMKKDVKISLLNKQSDNIKFSVLNRKDTDTIVINSNNGILKYWAENNSAGEKHSFKVVASDDSGWESKPLELIFRSVSKSDILPQQRVIKTGANDSGIGVDRKFVKNSDGNVTDPFGNIWEGKLGEKALKNNFYILAKNRCELMRLTNIGSNWRIPTVDELLNLVNYSKESDKSMLDDVFDANSSNMSVWAESENGKYFVVSQTKGLIFEVKSTDRYPIRCINAPKNESEHIVSSESRLNAVTYDFSTGLKWSPMSKDGYNIDNNASQYCKEYDNGSGWRLPSINEIRSISENGIIPYSIMNGNSRILSSTPYNDSNKSAKSAHYIATFYKDTFKIGVDYTDTLYKITCVKELNK